MTMTNSNRWRTAAALLTLTLSTILLMASGCGQSGAQRQQSHAAMGASIHQEWANRMQGAWERIDNQDDAYEASGAPTLRINKDTFHQAWSDGTARDSRWYVVHEDKDVVHIALESKDRAQEIWRIYLYSPQEMTAFAPGLPPATYKRRGVERSELSIPMQAESERHARSMQKETSQQDGQLIQTLSEEGEVLGESDTPQESSALQASTSHAPSNAQQSEKPRTTENAGGKRPSHHELEAIFQRIQHIQDAMTPADRELGERLLLGTWDLTDASLEEANAMRGDDYVPLEGAVLSFGPRQRLSMIWKTATDTVSNGLVWEIEGMYGLELRVILTEPNEGPTRERMQFLDVDHFVLDPEGANMRFERRAQ